MALARDLRVTATATLVAAATFWAGSASAEGLSLGVGASTATAPGGDGAATSPPSTGGADSAGAPAPEADAPGEPAPSSTGKDENPANYEFAFVSVGAYQTWAIAGDTLYFGMGGGLGPPLYRYGKLGDKPAGWDPTLEIAYANAFLRVAPVPYVDIDIGPKISLGSAMYDAPDAPVTAFAYGGYADLRVGSERIKVGPRFEYDRIAYAASFESGWRLTPLMLRVVH